MPGRSSLFWSGTSQLVISKKRNLERRLIASEVGRLVTAELQGGGGAKTRGKGVCVCVWAGMEVPLHLM